MTQPSLYQLRSLLTKALELENAAVGVEEMADALTPQSVVVAGVAAEARFRCGKLTEQISFEIKRRAG